MKENEIDNRGGKNEFCYKCSKTPKTASDTEASHRLSHREEFATQNTPEKSGASAGMGSDSIPFLGIAFSPVPERPAISKAKKLSRTELTKLESHLTARDHAVLVTIRKYRFLTSTQVGRLFFTNCTTKTSRSRNQNLLLKRLSGYGLIKPLKRRVGGEGGGSSQQVWHLTEAGQRLLTLNDPDSIKRKRILEPQPLFLEHTLAIAECAVQMTSLCRYSADLNLVAIDAEPTCWRRYLDDGNAVYLKPDLFTITTNENYEDRWFIEMDLGSESPRQVVDKCNSYLHYYYTGIEQKESGMFPLVVWIVKDNKRKERLKEYIRDSIKAQPKMFLVITPDELENTLRGNTDIKELC